jgi:hypothetical protein
MMIGELEMRTGQIILRHVTRHTLLLPDRTDFHNARLF